MKYLFGLLFFLLVGCGGSSQPQPQPQPGTSPDNPPAEQCYLDAVAAGLTEEEAAKKCGVID